MDPFEEELGKWQDKFKKLKQQKLDKDAIAKGRIISEKDNLLNGKMPSTKESLESTMTAQFQAKQSILRQAYPNNPICSCGCVMMERRNKKTGDLFWGCSNYPKCTETLRIKKH